jgi:mannose-6-phosphate isomerase-like protein (cupin superfamily)
LSTDQDLDLLAAEYVLGTLAEEERQAVTDRLPSDAGLRSRVAAWQRRLSELEAHEPGIVPPERLWRSLEAAIDAGGDAGGGDAGGDARSNHVDAIVVVRGDDRRWQPLAPGVDWLPLYQEPAQGWHAFLLRMAPGARLPTHMHSRAEECLVLEGELRIGGVSYVAGDYLVAPAGSQHPRVISRGGAIAYLRAATGEAA